MNISFDNLDDLRTFISYCNEHLKLCNNLNEFQVIWNEFKNSIDNIVKGIK